MSQYPHKVVILRSGFRYTDRPLVFGRAHLFFDRIELSGWPPAERFSRQIPLSSLLRVEWLDDGVRRARVVLHLQDGARVSLTLSRAARWRRLLAQRLSWFSAVSQPRHPDGHTLTLGEVAAFASSFS